MLKNLIIKNYRGVKYFNDTMSDVTIIVGDAGSGKSTIIDALRFLRDTTRNGLKNALLSRGIGYSNFSISAGFDIKKTTTIYTLKIQDNTATEVLVGNGVEVFCNTNHLLRFSLMLPVIRNELAIELKDYLQNSRFYTIYPVLLRESRTNTAGTNVLDDNGKNIANTLYFMRNRQEFNYLLSLMAALSPVDRILIKSIGVDKFVEFQYKYHLVPLSDESDTIIRYLVILTAILQQPLPLVAIDDVDRWDIVQKVIKQTQHKQILLTSKDVVDLDVPHKVIKIKRA